MMKLHFQQNWAVLMSFTVAWVFLQPAAVLGQDHVLGLEELQSQLRSTAEARARNTIDLDRVLSLPEAQEMLQKAGVNQTQVTQAVSLMSDQELSRLADRARSAEQDVHGGLIVGLLALIGLIVVIIIVVAVVKS
jgi:hypothetical protein